MNVTREDVRRVIAEFIHPEWEQGQITPASHSAADALIAAFPHLVGEVEVAHETSEFERLDEFYRVRFETDVRAIYTVTGDWGELR